ncbi:MAG: hypothetical protein K0S81_1221 [Rhodospirillales bacterium]|nr:hypothetical protein [Rhodospirillales bacterium]
MGIGLSLDRTHAQPGGGGGFPPPSPFKAGLGCRCPRCGKGKLYRGFLALRERCEICGLDYAAADTGDGPAVFLILIVGAIVVFAAVMVEISVMPPYWVHAVLWPPLILGLSLGLLRPAKALLMALQYRHQASEGGRGGFE